MKTVVEKASELVSDYYNVLEDVGCVPALVKSDAIRCAILCVDEIISDNPNIYDGDRINFKYWRKVREQINLL